MQCAGCDVDLERGDLGLAADLAAGLALCDDCRAARRGRRQPARFRPELRHCRRCGVEFTATRVNMAYCPHHRAVRERPSHHARSTVERGYGAEHRARRADWADVVAAGEAQCHAVVCVEPSRAIAPGAPWDMGHTPDRTEWTGPEHPSCNRSEPHRRRQAERQPSSSGSASGWAL